MTWRGAAPIVGAVGVGLVFLRALDPVIRVLVWRSRYDAVAPAIVSAAEAAPHLPPFARRMHRLSDDQSYLRLDVSGPVD